MASNLETAGSLADRLHAVVVLIRSCPDLGALRYRHSAIIHLLQGCVDHARVYRLRAGRPPQLDGLDWLSEVVQTHPAFEGKTADGQAMQAELQQLVARIAHGR